MGISNGRSFSQNIAENLGIEDFYLTATGTGDETQVMLSGRLNNRLLVRYGVGVFNAVSTLFLRYDLAEQLYIETTQGLEKAIDIFYSFEF
jgi:translocation and assembly module TamB